MGAPRAVTDATFTVDVLKSDRPVIVDFWAEWCTQCHRVDTMIASLAETDLADKVTFVKVDIDANPKITQTYRVMTVPTVAVFKNGEPVGSITGARPKGELIRIIESAL